MQLLDSKLLSEFSEIWHFITTKLYFFRCPFYKWEDKEIAAKNKEFLAEKLRIKNEKLIFLNQTHGTDIAIIDENNYTEEIYADAAITNTTWITLCVLASDCVPVLLYDTRNNVIWAVHAGWKGLIGEIIPKTLEKMQREFWSIPEDIIVYIWPCISQENYEVWDDVRNKIPEIYEKYIENSQEKEKYFLDIRGVATRQLLDSGILKTQMEVSQYCTYRDKDLFYSYRRKTHFLQEKYGNNAFGISLQKLTKS